MILGDETAKVFINASGTADDISDEMKAFLDYLRGKGSSTDFTRQIEEEVNRARAHEEWRVEYMALFLRDLDMREEGREEGIEENRRTVVMNMLKENEPIEKICRYTECDETFVEEIKKEIKNSKPES